jgi:Tol biopolymer transport system component
MSFAAGKRLGSYEILALIGVGGMGEVYRARDTRLERTVAIKVLPEHVAGDPDFKQRFEREAKTISSLNHPHICTLYDVGRENGVDFLVMELLEGETAAQRISRGAMPFAQVLRHGIEIAEALDRAHRQGITHRDLKPGNIMLTKSGAKLLDFGLAKLKSPPVQVAGSAATAAPNVLTASGTILGTLQYMAPEQLDGQTVDQRADVFAFGAILYEMATGRAAFDGKSQASLIGSILRDEPQPVSTLQPLSPPLFDALIATCLAKSPDDRWQSTGDLARQLRLLQGGGAHAPWATSSPAVAATAAARVHRWRRGAPFVLTAVAAAAVSGATVWALLRPTAPAPLSVSRFEIRPPANAPLANAQGYDLAISPDGRRIAYLAIAPRGTGTVLYVRELDELEPRMVPGTEEALGIGSAFFSADGRSIAFASSQNELMRVTLDGGPPLKIADIPAGAGMAGGSWIDDDTIVFANTADAYRVSAGGGTPERLTAEASSTVVAPVVLPGGRGVLLGLLDVEQNRIQVALLDLATRQQRIVVEGTENVAYSPSGHLIFARGSTLLAQRFDLERLEVVGEAVAVLQGVRRPANGAADFALAANGTLVYVADDDERDAANALVVVDRSGRVVQRALDETNDYQFDPRLSPDGRRLVVTVGRLLVGSANNNLWVHDLTGRLPIALTSGTSDNRLGIWSPDGARIAFSSNRDGPGYAVYTLPADGSSREPQPIEPRLVALGLSAWTSGGELLGWRSAGRGDIIVASVDGRGEVRDVVATADAESYPALSRDERWLAYVSDRTGRLEIWVLRYPDGIPVRVSRDGGTEPRWSHDGRELFYRQDGAMMAVAVDGSGDTLSFGPAVPLFTAPYFRSTDPSVRSYDVGLDGFVMADFGGSASGTEPARIVVIENWIEEVKRLVPVP